MMQATKACPPSLFHHTRCQDQGHKTNKTESRLIVLFLDLNTYHPPPSTIHPTPPNHHPPPTIQPPPTYTHHPPSTPDIPGRMAGGRPASRAFDQDQSDDEQGEGGRADRRPASTSVSPAPTALATSPSPTTAAAAATTTTNAATYARCPAFSTTSARISVPSRWMVAK